MQKSNKGKFSDSQKIASYAFKAEAGAVAVILKKADTPSLIKAFGVSVYAPESSPTGFSLPVLKGAPDLMPGHGG